MVVDALKSGLAWGPFFRIRVDIDITKPLMRGKMIHIEDVEEGWVYFKYERLPTFCYCCGILGHQERECQTIRKGSLSSEEDDLQYGPWLRAMAQKFDKGKRISISPNPLIMTMKTRRSLKEKMGMVSHLQAATNRSFNH